MRIEPKENFSKRIRASQSGLHNPECFGGFAQISRFDPEHSTIAARASAEDLHRRDVEVRLGEPAQDLGHRPRSVFALDEEPAFLGAQLEPCGFCSLCAHDAVFRDEVQLGSACAMWKC